MPRAREGPIVKTMVEHSHDRLARAHTALVPFVAAYGLPLNPEDLDEMAYAVISHLDTDESLQDIFDRVQDQIRQALPNPADTPNTGRARVWIFHGDGAPFASAVFHNKTTALTWIAHHHVTGILSQYPLGDGCYDIAVAEGRFTPTKPHHGNPQHIARFSPGAEHIHVRGGHIA